jgi:putative ABC transport system permease protein
MKQLVLKLTKDIRVNLLIIVTLALGLGVNTTVFSAVNGFLLKPLPFKDPDHLVVIQETKLPEFPQFSVASGNFLDFQKQNTTFESMGAFTGGRFNLLEGGKPESLSGLRSTASLSHTLGLKPRMGREFSEEEDQEGKSDVVIISHRLWVRRFNSDPNILTRRINIDGRLLAVIGVTSPDSGFPDLETDLWMPIAFGADDRSNHGGHNLGVIGRLKANTSVQQASNDLKQIARQLETAYPDSNQGWSVLLTPVRQAFIGEIQTAILLLWGAVAFVLLIACANIANLLLARSVSRQRDVAIQLALGATRFRITRELLTESIVLALIGGVAGLLVAVWGVHAVLVMDPDPESALRVRIEPIVMLFTALISVVTGVLFGLMPAIQLSKTDLNESLKEGGRGGSHGRASQRVRSALVIAEVSLSLVLLIGAGLVIRSFTKLTGVNPGFNMKNVLTADLTLPKQKYAEPDQQRRFVESTLREISSIPGVTAAAASQVIPFGGDYVLGILFEGRPAAKPSDVPSANYYSVSPDYFAAMGIPLKRGRVFTRQDGVGSTRVAVVSESFAARFFPNEDAIGKRIHITQGPQTWREIVGIVGDTKQYGLKSETKVQAYEPLAQMPFPFMTLVLRTAGNPMSLARAIEAHIQNVDHDQPLTKIRPLQEIVDESVTGDRIMMVLLSIFGSIALLMAATGLYGVMAYSVTQRTREIGLRMALGAEQTRVLRLVIRHGMVLTSIGLVLGLAAGFALTRFLQSSLYEIKATDVSTFLGISTILALVSLLACYVPARRASRVDPGVALRHE